MSAKIDCKSRVYQNETWQSSRLLNINHKHLLMLLIIEEN